MPTTVIHTLKPSGGDYTSISAWEAAQQRDLVTADELEVLECYKGDYTASGGGVDFINDAVTIDGWTMDATRYAVIKTPITERHTGKPRTGFRMQNASGTLTFCIDIAVGGHGVRIEGIEIDCAPGDRNKGISCNPNGGTTKTTVIDSCLVHSGIREHFNLDMYQSTTVVINCLAIDDQSSGAAAAFVLKRMQSGSAAYNCTGIVKNNNQDSFSLASDSSTRTWRLRNCLGLVTGTGRAFTDTSAFSGVVDIDYCASNDTSAPGTNSRISQTFTFVDEANRDYHLASTDTGARDFGVDLSSDSIYAFNWDIDGETRVAPWDIGADEYVAAGGGGATIVIGQASEADAAFAAARSKARTVLQASEADAALSAAAHRAVPIGISVELDAALAVTHGRIAAIGLAGEADGGLAAAHAKAAGIGIVSESDLAQPFSHGATAAIGQATEADAALAATWTRSLTVGLAEEIDVAQAMSAGSSRVARQAAESDAALSASAAKRRGVAQALEADQAQQFTSGAAVLIGVGTESDQASTVAGSKLAVIGAAQVSDAALAFAARRAVAIAAALEIDSALVVVPVVGKSIGQAVEVDVALGVLSRKLRSINLALESDTALLIAAGGAAVVPTVPGLEYTLRDGRIHFTLPAGRLHYTIH